MNRLRLAQLTAVIRLEFKKTLFARRGLWIYVLAALPVALYVAFAVVIGNQQHGAERLARRSEKALTYRDLISVKEGMTKQEVLALLGKPPVADHWSEERPTDSGSNVKIEHEDYHYSDGQNDLYVNLADGKVANFALNTYDNPGQDSIMFAGIFQFFFLRLAVFFGCLGIFMNLFRGEVLDRSLHFYFLAPIRRDILMVGKFLAGLLATCTIFVTSQVLQTCAFLWHFTARQQDVYLYHNHGLEHAATYIGVTVLACVGYGAFFLVAGMVFRNPIAPAAIALIWEGINPFLPNILKQISIIYYLKSLCPVDVPVDPGTPPLLALLISNGEPVSAPLAIVGILAVAAVALYISSIKVRGMEVNYTTE
jgi:ABC-type transport system involved in multi-copper enzyme maturation permease subunit